MNILVLTKLKLHLIKGVKVSDLKEYMENDYFFSGFADGFRKSGNEVFIIPDESFFFNYKFGLKHRILYRYFRGIINRLNMGKLDNFLFSKKIAKYINKNKIDFIFTELNDFIIPDVIKKYADRKVLISEWFGVFPEMVDKKRLNILSQYDFVWTPGDINEEFRKNNISTKNIYVINSAYNEKFLYNAPNEKFIHDVVFIGGIKKGHSERIEILENIAQNFDNFAFYGYGEEHIPDNYKLKKHFKGWASNKEAKYIYSNAKIAVNLLLDNYERVKSGVNARTFEIPACRGALQIAQHNKNIFDFFEEDKEIVIFKTIEELIGKIKYYLDNDNKRVEIVKKAYEKNLNNTYFHRARNIIKSISNKNYEK